MIVCERQTPPVGPSQVRATAAAIAVITLCMGASVARAQTAPDAGALQRQIEQERQPVLPPQAAPQFALPPPLQSLGQVIVTVHEFRFAGNTLLNEKQLQQATASYLNHGWDFNGLQNVARAVAEAYRQAGWVVRVYLPQQDVTNGVITIQIVEAKFGRVQIEGKHEHVSSNRLTRTVISSQPADVPVNANALDRALLQVNDLPGVNATGHLAEGASAQQTDLVLSVVDAPLVASSVYADNAGGRFTGAARGIVSLGLNSPFHWSDRLDLQLLHSQGSDYQRLGYALPLGYAGWRLGLHATHFAYDIVAPEFKALDAHGKSSAYGVEINYPIIRARLKNLFFSFTADNKSFDNKSGGITTTDYTVQTASLGLNGNLFDDWAGGGANTANLTLVMGRVDLSGSPNKPVDALTTKTDGTFKKLQFAISRQQAITDRVSIYGSLMGQRASKNLDSSEKLYLGGASGVRAYPVNEGGGSEGLLATLEGRMRLPWSLNGTGFIDWGSVKVNHNNDIIGAASPNRITLKGVGISLDWRASFGLSIKATVAHRLGSNPALTLAGTDQDGSLIKNRFWIQANLPF